MLLCGCVTSDQFGAGDTAEPNINLGRDPLNSQLLERGINALKKSELQEASRAFNTALSRDIANSTLQYLNGMTYHLMARRGEGDYFDLAATGYEVAINQNHTNWMAHLQMGLLYLERRNYRLAKFYLSTAAYYRPSDPEILYPLAVAAYYDQDLGMAAGLLDRILLTDRSNPNVLGAASLVHAALGNKKLSRDLFEEFSIYEKDLDRIHITEKRSRDWERFRAFSDESVVQANFLSQNLNNAIPDFAGNEQSKLLRNIQEEALTLDNVLGYDPSDSADESPPAPTPPDTEGMVALDVVIVRTEESITTSKGVNLLNGLLFSFGTSSDNAFSLVTTRTKDTSGAANENNAQRVIINAISIPQITHILNIANAGNTRNEVLARPTLVAKHGEQATFFSGRTINAVVVGGGTAGGTEIINSQIGVTLVLTPRFLENDKLQLSVEARRTFIIPKDTLGGITFSNQINTSETVVSSVVVLDFDHTLILSGLSEREDSYTRDGVPFLQDIPLLQYFFSNLGTTEFHKSVLILVTPRRISHVYKPDQNNMKQSPGDESQSNMNGRDTDPQFLARYGDWFKPYPNVASVFRHMQDNSLYREFRTGDVRLEDWHSLQKIGERLQQAKDFLRY
jgi:Flp pilus assembly secretin CpaC/Tfp pilus assembly protein PilF